MKDNEVVETEDGYTLPKNKGGRPRKHVLKARVSRDSRVPLSGIRDILTVEGKDPNYHYSWPLDESEHGVVIQRFIDAGYEFVAAHTVKVGQTRVYQAKDIGTIVRVPAGSDGRYHYLMRIPMQYYLDDQAALEIRNKEMEQSIHADGNAPGMYGEVKLTRK